MKIQVFKNINTRYFSVKLSIYLMFIFFPFVWNRYLFIHIVLNLGIIRKKEKVYYQVKLDY